MKGYKAVLCFFVCGKNSIERYVCGISVWFPVSVFRPREWSIRIEGAEDAQQSGLPSIHWEEKGRVYLWWTNGSKPNIWDPVSLSAWKCQEFWWCAMCDGTSILMLLLFDAECRFQNLYRSSSCDANPVPPANRDTGAPRLFSIDILFPMVGW